MDTSGQKFDIFLSHAGQDKADLVRTLVECLQNTHRLSVWLDEGNLEAGDHLRECIEQAIVSSRFGVLILSPAAAKSPWVNREIDSLLVRNNSGKLKIIPVYHKMTVEQAHDKWPLLSCFVGVSSDQGISSVAKIIAKAVAGNASIGDEGNRHGGPDKVPNFIPKAPSFYAEPDYIGSHQFVGREDELRTLSNWASPFDSTNLLLFEAIGGSGKSMLCWEWTTKYASSVRSDWAGRFWYSFYERGAVMQDFCQRALAYMTGRPFVEFQKLRTIELRDDLLRFLHDRPWLLILDGFERVLVAYHRLDAAEIPDEEAETFTDKILTRNARDTIRDEDNDLLRALAAATPSKILISSRLTPRILLNPSEQTIQGVRRITLSGLLPKDAEILLRNCGITGASTAIRDYLSQNCANHPLVIGVLAGLINDYLQDRGNFDAWNSDPSGGAALDLGKLDLNRRRNHILEAAFNALPDTSRRLLASLALLSDSVDYDTLKAFNPHLPPEPESVPEPLSPDDCYNIEDMTDDEFDEEIQLYLSDLASWERYNENLQAWQDSLEDKELLIKLAQTVKDLEQGGFLQHNPRTRRYEIHPVTRSVAAGSLDHDDKERYGLQIADHFSTRSQKVYDETETMEELASDLQVVRSLVKIGRFQESASFLRGGLSRAMLFNLEAHFEILSLLRPCFANRWAQAPIGVALSDAAYLADVARISLDACGATKEARIVSRLSENLQSDIETQKTEFASRSSEVGMMRLLKVLRVDGETAKLRVVYSKQQSEFMKTLRRFRVEALIGDWNEAELTWQLLEGMRWDWSRDVYRQGDADYLFVLWKFWEGLEFDPELMGLAAAAAAKDHNRPVLRSLHRLSGSWKAKESDYAGAINAYQTAVRMARERRLIDAESETGLVMAKFHLRQVTKPQARREAARLAQLERPAHRYLSMLWDALGNYDQARQQALAAYKWAWAEGEPYVRRYELNKTTELLQKLKINTPSLPSYDPMRMETVPWDTDERAAINEFRAENEGNVGG